MFSFVKLIFIFYLILISCIYFNKLKKNPCLPFKSKRWEEKKSSKKSILKSQRKLFSMILYLINT